MAAVLRFNQKRQLVDALEARRKWAETHDKREAKKHRADEDAVLRDIKKRCAEVARLSLPAIKDTLESEDSGRKPLRGLLRGDRAYDLPTCPRSAVTLLNEALAQLTITKQESFVLRGDSADPVAKAHWLLMHNDEPRPATVCAES